MDLPYDVANPKSIDSYTERLIGHTLREFTEPGIEISGKGRGDLGSMVEKYFFRYVPPSTHEPDFAEAGLELKVTGLKRLKNGTLTPKERLVLGMISYHEVVNETFGESYILRKIRLMLIIFYLYQSGVSYLDMKFLAKNLWRMSEEDLIVIAKDWETIIRKIKDGKAHELSEADTLYLGACTKAATSKSRTSQPYSDEPAKPRAFALKASYVRVVMEDTLKSATEFSNLLDTQLAKEKTLEEVVTGKLEPYFGEDADDLLMRFAPDVSVNSKHRYAVLTNRLLGVRAKKVSEFEKAGIIIRTIRTRADGMPKEDISFPAFDYFELAGQEWDDSAFKDVVESEFLFIVLEEMDGGLVFRDAKFWRMPYQDRQEAERIWAETVTRIRNNRADRLPPKTFSKVAHVRPHGANAQDTLLAPGGLHLVKKCFWLNASYIKNQLTTS
jgi:DNA mismatch repair protein MutH